MLSTTFLRTSDWYLQHVAHNFPPLQRSNLLPKICIYLSNYQESIDSSFCRYQDSILVLIQIWRFTLRRVEKKMKSQIQKEQIQKESQKNVAVFCTFWLQNVLLATAACNFSTSQLQKMLRDRQFFYHFDLEIYFSPERRAIFQHLNFKKCSETVSFLTFWVGNALLATAACNFSTSQLQKVLRDRQFFNVLASKCASRHSGVQFLNISTSKRVPNPNIQFF